MNKYILYIALPLVVFACKKAEEDTKAPILTITYPTDGLYVKAGDTVYVKGTATDEELHELHIHITKQNDTSEYFHVEPHVHEKQSYEINEMWVVPTLRDTTAVVLKSEAHDHHEHSTETEVKFYIKP